MVINLVHNDINKLAIVGIVDEDPFNALTWSGSSRYFFNELMKKECLVGAFSAEPNSMAKKKTQALSFSLNYQLWKKKYHLSTILYGEMTKTVRKKILKSNLDFNILLQIGAWYNLCHEKQLQNKIFCSYHDGNLMLQIRRKDFHYNKNSKFIKRALSFERDLYSKLNIIFTMSNWLRKSFINDFGCDSEKVVTVGAGVNLQIENNKQNKDYSKRNIAFVGIDFRRKGGKILLDAFRRVRKEFPDACLTIVGPNLSSLPEGVKTVGRILKTTSEGQKKMRELYTESSIFVLPSLYEPFGIALLEAMAYSLPCIGTSVCAIPEIVENGKTGFLVPPGNSKQLALKIIEMFKNPKLMKSMGECGYKKYQQQFTWNRVTQNIVETLQNRMK